MATDSPVGHFGAFQGDILTGYNRMQYINNLAEFPYPLHSSDICIVLYILCVMLAQVKSIVLENGQSDLYDEWPRDYLSSEVTIALNHCCLLIGASKSLLLLFIWT